MQERECLIAEIRQQRKALSGLMDRIAAKLDFEQEDSYLFEAATKEVERSLRRINSLLTDEFLKNLSQIRYYN